MREAKRGEEKKDWISEVRVSNSAASASRVGGWRGRSGMWEADEIDLTVLYIAESRRDDLADCMAVDIVEEGRSLGRLILAVTTYISERRV